MHYRPGTEIALQLIGRLLPDEGEQPGWNGVVHGEWVGGEAVTLLHCYRAHQITYFGGSTSQTIGANGCIIGKQLGSRESEQFHAWEFRLTHLDRWVWHSPFKSTRLPDAVFSMSATEPPSYSWHIPAIDSTLELYGQMQSGGGSFFEYNSKISWELSLKPDRPRSYEWFIEAAWHIRCLFSLLVGRPVVFSSVRFPIDANNETFLRGSVLFLQGRSDPDQRDPHFQDLIAPLRQIEGMFEPALAAWFEKQRQLAPMLNLFINDLLAPPVYNSSVLLGLIQVVEGCSRLAGRGSLVPAADFDPIKSAVLAAIPSGIVEELAQRLKQGVSTANEVSLRKRLLEQIELLGHRLHTAFFWDSDDFAREATIERNYLAHFLADGTARVQSDRRRMLMIDRLRLLALAALLREVGLSIDESGNGVWSLFGGLSRKHWSD